MAPTLNPTRVLCVDDNHDTADSEAMLLQLAGYETLACYSGQSAIIEAAKFLPDICLIDMNMPGMDGDELVGRLRNLDRHIVMMAATAMNDAVGCERIRVAGFDRHLLKPVAPQDLLAAVRERRSV